MMFGCSVTAWTNRQVILAQFLTFYPLTGLAIKLYKETRMPENAKETMISHKNMIISFIAELWFWTAMV